MAYSETYVSADMSKVIIDLLVTVAAALVGFGTIIGLVMLARWLRGRKAI